MVIGKLRIAAYTRVSSEQQLDNLSLDTQRRLIAEYVARQGWDEPEYYEERGRSAYRDNLANRPELVRLLTAIEAGTHNAIILLDLDRLARNTLIQLTIAQQLRQNGCRIISLNQTVDLTSPEGNMMFAINASVNELFSAQISRKSKAGLAEVRARGGHVGGLPYGAMRDADYRLVVDPARAEALQLLLTLVAATSYRHVADELNRRGIRPPQQRTALWRNTSIQSIVGRGRWLLDQPPPWPRLWLAAQGRPRQSRANTGRTIRALSGLMRCACGGVIVYSGYHEDRATGERRQGIHCRHWTRERSGGSRCPYRKTYARHYEDLATAELLGLPDLTRVEIATVDVQSARAALAARRLNLARAVAVGLPPDEAEALDLAIAAEEARLPLDDRAEREMAEELLIVQGTWARRSPEERNAAWHRLALRVVITGRELVVEWQPPIARLLAEWRRISEN